MAASPSSRGADAPSQTRTSSRVRRPPEHFTSSPFTNGSKRKRAEITDADGDEAMNDADDTHNASDSDDSDDDDDDEPDDEEIREKARRARKAKRAAPKKPAQKKPKVDTLSLPFRAAKGSSKKRAPRRVALAVDSADAEAAGGLYAEIFARNEPAEQVVARWLKAFNEHESRALANVINFVLKAAGCNGKVTEHDIEDPDGATARLTDLQDEHQASEPTEYPLIAKGKNAAIFKERVSGFMHTLVRSIAASDLLYNNPELIENIEVWLSTMSSAANRSFRHTSAVVSLAVISALCEIARELVEKSSNNQRHAQTERKKARVNKARVSQIEESVKDANVKLEFLEALLKDWFDTVFIHRYRDIDPAIRRDSVAALGDWIVTMPDTFFDGHHLRYLGWVLCDISPATRGEDLKQLRRLYSDKDKLGGLKTFTERFRMRLVEIATADAEVSVRIAGIDLLDLLRENGLLEPDDIDAVGRLIFHDDVRVRRAVANFFSENVNDLYTSKIDDLGGAEGLEDVLPEVGEDNFSTPRLEWLRYKSLAELFNSYDDDDGGIDDALPSHVVRNKSDGSLTLQASGIQSRFTLAADVLCKTIDDLQEWQTIAGYLLVDHSTTRANGTSSQSPLSQLKHECALSEKEVLILLEVLNSSVRYTLTELAEKIAAPKGKLTQRQKDSLQDEQEEATRHLAEIIPELIKKFGDAPGSASAVLRLEALMVLPAFDGLRQDAANNVLLLELLSKQFMSHGTDELLTPAADAILRISTSGGETDDAAAEKISALWESIVLNTTQLLDVSSVIVRGSLDTDDLIALGNNLLRVVRLGAVMSCIDPLEDSSVAATSTVSGKEYSGAIDYLLDLVQRAVPRFDGTELSPQDEELEDRIAIRASEAALFYFRWKFLSIMTAITSNSSGGIAYEMLEALAERRDTYVEHLLRVLQARRPTELVSQSLAGCLLDIYTSAALLRTVKAPPGLNDDYTVLIMDLDSTHERAIMHIFAATEKTFARLSHKKIEETTSYIETPVKDLNPDADPASDDDDEANGPPDDKHDDPDAEVAVDDPSASSKSRDADLAKSLLAEQRLCTLASKLIYALAAGIISPTTTRQRLELNRTRLGPNYKEVIAYLDTSRGVQTRRGGTVPATKQSKSQPQPPNTSTTAGAGEATSRKQSKRADPKSHALVTEDETDDEIEDVNDDEDDENGDVAPPKQSVLGIDVDAEPLDEVEDIEDEEEAQEEIEQEADLADDPDPPDPDAAEEEDDESVLGD